jgi:hypothetical protein
LLSGGELRPANAPAQQSISQNRECLRADRLRTKIGTQYENSERAGDLRQCYDLPPTAAIVAISLALLLLVAMGLVAFFHTFGNPLHICNEFSPIQHRDRRSSQNRSELLSNNHKLVW